MNNLITMRASDGNIVKIECHDSITSTSSLAKDYAKLGYPDRYVIFSDKRVNFLDVEERGVYMSCILRPSIFPSQAALISSLSAAAVVTALEEYTTKPLGIGWVSKIYCGGRLIGDVSIEGKLDNFKSYEYIIINFSLKLDKEDFPPRITDLIRKVFESDNSSVPIIIAKSILNKFFPYYLDLRSSEKFMDIYNKKFLLRGTKIKYLNDGKKESCKVLQVSTEDCSLLVETKKKDAVKIFTPNKVIIPKKIKMKR